MGRKKRRRNGGSILKTVYKLVPVAALAAPAIGHAMRTDISNKKKAGVIIRAYTGFSMPNMVMTKGFNFSHLIEGWGPFVVTSLMVMGVQKLRGIIRRL